MRGKRYRGGELRLEDRGLGNLTQAGVPHDGSYQHFSAAPAHDRGHDGACLGRQTQRGHVLACKRFAAYLKRSPDTATAEDVRLFQLQLMENGLSIQNRNRTMTGVRFLLRVTMRRHDLAAEVFHMKEPQKIPQILSAGEAKRL